MICKSCRAAARLLNQPPGAHPEKHIAEQAHKFRVQHIHQQCPGGTWCDCQHVIPAWAVPDEGAHPTLNM